VDSRAIDRRIASAIMDGVMKSSPAYWTRKAGHELNSGGLGGIVADLLNSPQQRQINNAARRCSASGHAHLLSSIWKSFATPRLTTWHNPNRAWPVRSKSQFRCGADACHR